MKMDGIKEQKRILLYTMYKAIFSFMFVTFMVSTVLSFFLVSVVPKVDKKRIGADTC